MTHEKPEKNAAEEVVTRAASEGSDEFFDDPEMQALLDSLKRPPSRAFEVFSWISLAIGILVFVGGPILLISFSGQLPNPNVGSTDAGIDVSGETLQKLDNISRDIKDVKGEVDGLRRTLFRHEE